MISLKGNEGDQVLLLLGQSLTFMLCLAHDFFVIYSKVRLFFCTLIREYLTWWEELHNSFCSSEGNLTCGGCSLNVWMDLSFQMLSALPPRWLSSWPASTPCFGLHRWCTVEHGLLNKTYAVCEKVVQGNEILSGLLLRYFRQLRRLNSSLTDFFFFTF